MPLLAALVFSGAWTNDMVISLMQPRVITLPYDPTRPGRGKRSKHAPWFP